MYFSTMFKEVPAYQLEADVKIGDINVNVTKSRARENSSYVSKTRRLFPQRSKNDEHKLSLGFFLQRLSFLGYKETAYLFRCVDAVKNVSITKKNNVIIAPYIALITMASKGYKLTETMLQLYFPELYSERSKRFKFSTQIMYIQDKLGYPQSEYFVYSFEEYFSTVALIIRDETDTVFDSRKESSLISSLSEITYRFYLKQLKEDAIQWSVSTGTLITQMINTVLIATYEMLKQAIELNASISCKLAKETPVPFNLLIENKNKFINFINDIKKLESFKVNKKEKDFLMTFFELN
ncbi:small subunit viral intermediate transcription factor [Pteropox virus]|uniref:Intermediate transcription factor 3 small subunit n=1 Tax=Pteropox virus TaxID=1873698 RepID=A0A1B1MRE2_9POXV|nr:small subunit viral intermediate transcription factor [Pteropox virus]ANS71186.1 small subunit viral intermediate transcription factor [Pteropox virus]